MRCVVVVGRRWVRSGSIVLGVVGGCSCSSWGWGCKRRVWEVGVCRKFVWRNRSTFCMIYLSSVCFMDVVGGVLCVDSR
ncbi:hypothetical protein BDW42DRAFT_164108 [Aspergillus taichungensis]|uniref:Uncharacterized protein n=1 Tax=Aspergillus taichungensis TaxID=482145 RepID=A0A2J5I1U6_9EURO|nr:hypothetical protein BDW42DRAFT_164108 [Aspergillus taichungensis]